MSFIEKLEFKLEGTFLLKVLTFLGSKLPTFEPVSNFKMIWHMSIFFVIGILTFLTPIVAIYQIPIVEIVAKEISQTSVILMLIDMIFNLNTKYFKQGVLEQQRWNIIKNYAQTKFLTDFVVIVPLVLAT